MALTGTDRGSGNNGVAGTTFNLSPGSNCTAGAMLVLCVALDNSSSGGSTNDVTSVTDSAGNAWTIRQSPIFDNGAASAGVQGIIATTLQNAGTLTTGSTITVTTGTSPTAKAWVLHEVTAAANFRPNYVTGASSTGTTSGTPTVTTGTIANGDMVIGMGCAESGDTWAGDGDTSNGSWSTHQHNASGTGATGMSITSQRKVVSASATQTYNPTLTSADVILTWIELQEVAAVKTLAALGVG